MIIMIRMVLQIPVLHINIYIYIQIYTSITMASSGSEMMLDGINRSVSAPSSIQTPGPSPLVRVSSTMSNTSFSGVYENSLISVLTDAKTLHAEKLLMRDRITKLSVQLVAMASQLQKSENQRMRTERELDKILSSKEIEAASTLSTDVVGSDESKMDVDITVGSNTSTVTTSSAATGGIVEVSSHENQKQLDELLLLKKQVDLLGKQLSESESAKTKVQMVLTERLGKPLAQTEAQITDLRRSIDQLRLQHKSRVTALLAEGSGNQQKRSNAEATLTQLEGVYKTKMGDVVAATEYTIKTLQSEKEIIQSELITTKASANMVPGLKKQVQGLLELEHRFRVEGLKLKDTITKLNDLVDKKEDTIVGYRTREVNLESQLNKKTDTETESTSTSTKVDLLKQAHNKIKELEGVVEVNKGKLN